MSEYDRQSGELTRSILSLPEELKSRLLSGMSWENVKKVLAATGAEVPLTMGTGAGAFLASGLGGALATPFIGPERAGQRVRDFQEAFTYAPLRPESEKVISALDPVGALAEWGGEKLGRMADTPAGQTTAEALLTAAGALASPRKGKGKRGGKGGGDLPPGDKPTAIGLIDWKRMSPEERQAFAMGDNHVRQMPDGKFVGTPGFRSMEQIHDMRNRLYTEMKGIMELPWVAKYGPWYERQRQGVMEMSGPDPVRQDTAAQGIGIYSPQSTPATNLTSAVNQAAHYSVTGDPTLQTRTGAQARNYANPLTNTARATQGPKTGPFSESSNPTRFDPDMSTNDIWVGRFLGYDGGKFSRGFTPQEHGFVQGEMQRMTALANKEKWGGRGDWHVEELQALPWVEYKARDLVKKRKNMNYDQAVQEAMDTTLEALYRNTTNLPNELIPAKVSGHLPALLTAPLNVKMDFTNAKGNFVDPNQRNALWQSLPKSFEREAIPAQGIFENMTGGVENQPVINFRPLTGRLPAGEFGIAPSSQHALNVQQGMHGLFNVQEGSVSSQFFPRQSGMNKSDINAALLKAPVGRAPITATDLTHLAASGKNAGIPNPVHYGGGDVMLTNFDKKAPPSLTPQQMKQIEAARQPGTALEFGRRVGDGVWLGKEWSQPQGTGAVTNKILRLLNRKPKQSAFLLEQYDKNPEVLAQIGAMNERDANVSQLLQTPERADVRKLRDDVVNKFGSLTAFFDHVRKYGAAGYPAAGLVYLAQQQDDEDSLQ
jgi:hypothetical protein